MLHPFRFAFALLIPLAADGLLLGQELEPAASQASPSSANVREFGARGDGEADDTQALQKAIDAGLGHVLLPKGRYRITRPLLIDLDRSGYVSIDGNGVAEIIMAGPGPALRLVGTHFQSAAPSTFEERVWTEQRMPTIDGLAIRGDHPESVGIEASGTMQLTITRVHIRHALHGIHLIRNNRNLIISDCHVYENRGIGVYYDNVNLHQSNVTGCHISYNAGGGLVARGGNVRNIHISGCDLESNMSPETEATANILIDCRGSRYGTAEVAITGCTIQHNHTSPDSANIRVIGRSEPTADQELVREGHVTIVGNVLSDVQANVHLRDCRGVVLSGNTFWMGFEHNLLVEDCSNVVIGPNNFDRNPRYDYGDSKKARNALVIRDSEDITLMGLHVSQVLGAPAGLQLIDCRRCNITGCTILDCEQAELRLENVHDSQVSGTLLHDRRDPAGARLQVSGGSNNRIDKQLTEQD